MATAIATGHGVAAIIANAAHKWEDAIHHVLHVVEAAGLLHVVEHAIHTAAIIH